MFELTVHFKHEIIGMLQRFQRNFELTVFEITVPDLYQVRSFDEPSVLMIRLPTDISLPTSYNVYEL